MCTTKHKKTKTAYKQSLEGKVDISELYGTDFMNQIKKKFFEIHIRGWGWGGIITFSVVEATKGNQLFLISQTERFDVVYNQSTRIPKQFFTSDKYWKHLIWFIKCLSSTIGPIYK